MRDGVPSREPAAGNDSAAICYEALSSFGHSPDRAEGGAAGPVSRSTNRSPRPPFRANHGGRLCAHPGGISQRFRSAGGKPPAPGPPDSRPRQRPRFAGFDILGGSLHLPVIPSGGESESISCHTSAQDDGLEENKLLPGQHPTSARDDDPLISMTRKFGLAQK